MIIKIIIIIVMLLILAALINGFIGLIRDSEKSTRTVKSLTIRISIAIALFVFLILACKLHWITPHPIGQ